MISLLAALTPLSLVTCTFGHVIPRQYSMPFQQIYKSLRLSPLLAEEHQGFFLNFMPQSELI